MDVLIVEVIFITLFEPIFCLLMIWLLIGTGLIRPMNLMISKHKGKLLTPLSKFIASYRKNS